MAFRVVHVLAVRRDGQSHCYLFDRESLTELARTLGRHAADPDLSLTWSDAAELMKQAYRLLALPT